MAQMIQLDKLLTVNNCPPEPLKPWLSHSALLTQKLKALSGDAEIEVLSQGWTQPSWWDKYTLGLKSLTVRHRDILMYSHETPCWFARTIIPEASYENNRAIFDRLKHEALSTILFSEPKLARISLQNYAISKDCLEYHWLPAALKSQTESSELWLRFSVFSLPDNANFYLVEILLPGLNRVIQYDESLSKINAFS